MKCDECGREERDEFMIWVGGNVKDYNFCSKICQDKFPLTRKEVTE